MTSEVERLASGARELAAVAADRPEGARAAVLAERLEAGRFVIAVVGEFNRGKSTLINALVGEAVLPAGTLPLTAVPTELVWGEPGAVVHFLDGGTRNVARDAVADFVTEAANPGNVKRVARVEVRGRWPLCASGAVLVDAPGTGSVHAHNTEAGRRALLEADGAVMVLAADIPVSAAERDLVRLLAERRGPVFWVLNKVDHLPPGELDALRRFVGSVLAEELGAEPMLYAVSALEALRARAEGAVPGPAAGEFERFRADMERFVRDDLAAARLATARRELARLADSLRAAVRIERAALELQASAVAERVARFRAEADRQRRAFDDACVVCERDVGRLAAEVGRRLAAFAQDAPVRFDDRLVALAASAPRGRLYEELWAAVAGAVQEAFEVVRREEARHVDEAWRRIAGRFLATAQQHAQGVRDAAAALFSVPLPAAPIPAVSERRETFFYLLIEPTTFNEPFVRLLGRLLPGRLARRRALAWARGALARELDKHAGRVRADLATRLDAARRDFEAAMRRELDETIAAVTAAAAKAAEVRDATAAARDRWVASAEALAAVADRVAALARDAPPHALTAGGNTDVGLGS